MRDDSRSPQEPSPAQDGGTPGDRTRGRSIPVRILRWVGFVLAGLVGFIILTIAVLVLGANTGPGRRMIEQQAKSLTGGMVVLQGMGGRFPDALSLHRLELHDAKGVWLAIDNLEFDWSPLRLLTRTARVDLLRFDRLSIPRLAETQSPSTSSSSTGTTKTGFSIDLRSLDARRIEIGAGVAGVPAVFSITGRAKLASVDDMLGGPSFDRLPAARIVLSLRRLDTAGSLDLAARTTTKTLALHLTAQDGKDGFVARIASLPELTPVALALDINGPTNAAKLDFHASGGPITASIKGDLDLVRHGIDLTVAAHAPALTLAMTKAAATTPAGATPPGATLPGTASPGAAAASATPAGTGGAAAPAGPTATSTQSASQNAANAPAAGQPQTGAVPTSPPSTGTVPASAAASSASSAIGWQEITLNTRLRGTITAPIGDGKLVIDRLAAGGAGIGGLVANFNATGNDGQLDQAHLHATATGVRIPGSNPTLLAADPIELDAMFSPSKPGRPLALQVTHPVLHLSSQITTTPAIQGTLSLDLPDLAPLAAMGGQKLAGAASVSGKFAMPPQSASATGSTTVSLDGTIAARSGLPQAVSLIGPEGKFSLSAAMVPQKGGDRVIRLDSFTLDGKALHLTSSGTATQTGSKTALDLQAALGLPALSALAPGVQGGAKLTATAKGPTDDLAAVLHLEADPGTATLKRGTLVVDVDASHLPGKAAAHVTASGLLDGAKLALDTALSTADNGSRHVDLTTLSWNSLTGKGALDLRPGEIVPLGTLDVRMTRLADLRGVIGQAISGAFEASVRTDQSGGKNRAVINATGNAALPQARVGSFKLSGSVLDPAGTPDADLALALDGLSAPQATGSLKVTAKGKLAALAILAQAKFSQLTGEPGALDASALVDVPDQHVRLDRLTAMAKGENLRLLAPATVSFGKTMGVDRLRATLGPNGVAPATLDAAGTIKPALSFTAAIDHLTPGLAHPFMPTLNAAGTLSATAKLTGTLAQPQGIAQIQGRGLKMLDGPAASVPAGQIDTTIRFAGTSARVDAKLSAGPKLDMTVNGTVPVSATGPLNVHAAGMLDLDIANAALGAAGRQAEGQVRLDMTVGGTASAPTATGSVMLHNGDIQDFAQGVRIRNIEANILAQRDQIVIQSFTAQTGDAKASTGPGTIGLTGTVGAFQPGMPVSLHMTANQARPISSDLITALINADITVKGQATTRLDVDGTVTLPRVDINIPNSMPSSVAQLNVIRPGDKPPSSGGSAGSAVIGLNLAVKSPGQFFVRGHGLDAEMGGNLRVSGTTATPVVEGGFDLKRGMFDLAGIVLNFTHGRVGFNGAGVSHKLDPSLDFEADRNVSGQTAMLKVSGYASGPKIGFDSIPSLPQDQVVALLLFGTDAHSLSSTQMAEVAAALATLSGSSSFDPLGTVRKSLGLDRLAVGGGSGVGNGGTSIEAGKYVMKGVYVGAKQATSGSGTQAQVQVDLTQRLKLNTVVGTGGNVTGFTTPENDPGSSVGLSWQYRY